MRKASHCSSHDTTQETKYDGIVKGSNPKVAIPLQACYTILVIERKGNEMKVFIVMGIEPYEADVILGVFHDHESAEKRIEECRSDCEYFYSDYEIDEWEVK